MPTVVWKGKSSLFTAGVNTTLVEQPDSPKYKFGDRSTCTRKFKGLHSLCLSSAVGQGAVGTGDMSGWVVANCDVERESKQIGTLVIEYEATAAVGGGPGLVLPVDTASCHPFEINPRVETHPNYQSFDADMFKEVQACANMAIPGERDRLYSALTAEEKQLVDFITRGVETFYLAGVSYTWTSYSWDFPSDYSSGGFIESPAGPIASELADLGLSWLRQADDVESLGSYFRHSRTWMGAPSGHWSPDLY